MNLLPEVAMGEIVPGNGKYGAAGFFATERALSWVLLFACVAVVFTCGFLVWRDVESPPAEDPVEARRSVTVELDLRRPPVASPSAMAPSVAPSAVGLASPSPAAAPRPVAVVGVPVTSGQVLPSPTRATASPEPSPDVSKDGDASPSPRAGVSASPAPKAAPKPPRATGARPTRVVVTPSAGAPGSRRTPPPIDALRIPDVPIPAGTSPPSWQPPGPVQPPVVMQPTVPTQPSYPPPADPSATATVTLIGQMIHPVQDQGGSAISDQVILVNLANFQSTRGNLGADGSFTFTNLVPRARYCLSAWHHRRSATAAAPGAPGGAFEAKLSWHQAVVAARSGTYSVSLNPQNADPFYCVDQLLPSDLPGRQSSLRSAELQLIQRQGYR